VCRYPGRANRPQTFCCVVCGCSEHVDPNVATDIAHRWDDVELRACKDRKDLWRAASTSTYRLEAAQRLVVVRPAAWLVCSGGAFNERS
jgi:hypothetical protein